MKKSVILIMGLLLFPICFAQSITLGDVNGSGRISIVDALMVAKYYVNLETTGFIEEAADVDCSGTILILDALMIAQHYVGTISEFPCEIPATYPDGELTILYARHAETEANASGEMGGGGDPATHDVITDLGFKQIEALKNFLIDEEIDPDVILVSPSLRCQKTIEPYLVATGKTAEIWVSLNECCGQDPDGSPVPTERPDHWWKFDTEIVAENTIFGSEEDEYLWLSSTYAEGLFMVMSTRDRIFERYGGSGKTILIIGHAVNGNKLLGLLTGYDIADPNTPTPLPFYLFNTGIFLLEQESDSEEFKVVDRMLNHPPL